MDEIEKEAITVGIFFQGKINKNESTRDTYHDFFSKHNYFRIAYILLFTRCSPE